MVINRREEVRVALYTKPALSVGSPFGINLYGKASRVVAFPNIHASAPRFLPIAAYSLKVLTILYRRMERSSVRATVSRQSNSLYGILLLVSYQSSIFMFNRYFCLSSSDILKKRCSLLRERIASISSGVSSKSKIFMFSVI